MRKLNFHKAVNDGRFRLPRVSFHQDLENAETYESLHRVLEELEMLLKLWQKRTKHVFTAHIARPGEEDEDEETGKEGGRSKDKGRTGWKRTVARPGVGWLSM